MAVDRLVRVAIAFLGRNPASFLPSLCPRSPLWSSRHFRSSHGSARDMGGLDASVLRCHGRWSNLKDVHPQTSLCHMGSLVMRYAFVLATSCLLVAHPACGDGVMMAKLGEAVDLVSTQSIFMR